MRFFVAAVVAFGIMTIDFKADDDHQESIFTAAAAQAEPKVQSAAQSIGKEDAVDGLETNDLSVISEAVPQATEQVQELPKKNFCSALKEAAESSSIPIGFFARLLWQESRFRSSEVSSAGAQGVAQFMPGTAAEVGLDDPFDPFKALPASAKFLRKLHDEFGNLGLAAAAYNAGSGRIRKWLSGRGALPRETRDYVRIITGNAAENWLQESRIVSMQSELPRDAPCEGVGGLSKAKEVAAVPVALASSISSTIKNAAREVPGEVRRVTAAALEAAKTKTKVVLLLKNKIVPKQLVSSRTGSLLAASRSAEGKTRLRTAETKRALRSRTKAAARSRQSDET
jgi:hypothetical protein